MSAAACLIGIPISPYTERARWALDYRKVPYRFHEHLVLLGMPLLRLRTGRLTGDLTVPVLLDGKQRFFDSFDIARHADAHDSGGERLFPADLMNEIRELNALGEEALDAGRALALTRMLGDEQALRESVPAFFPRALSAAGTPLVKMGVSYLCREFGVRRAALAAQEARLTAALERLSKRLRAGGGRYLLSRLTYADFATAVALQFASPVADRYLRLGAGARRVFTQPGLAHQFDDLVRWRDALYERHRLWA